MRLSGSIYHCRRGSTLRPAQSERPQRTPPPPLTTRSEATLLPFTAQPLGELRLGASQRSGRFTHMQTVVCGCRTFKRLGVWTALGLVEASALGATDLVALL